MSRRRSGKPPAGGSYQVQLRRAMSRVLPRRGLAVLPGGDGRLRWTARLLVVCAVLMAWDPSDRLKDRFAAARACVVGMYATRRRPGGTCEGFLAALARSSAALLGAVAAHLRGRVREAAGSSGRWLVRGWCAFGCDSSKVDCPMTAANEAALGCCHGKSWPQQLLTTLFHAGSGLPWAFVRGGAKDSERSHLLRMIDTLPTGPDAGSPAGRGVLLLADAGFTGYDLLEAVLCSGRSILLRVGSGVRLLTRLGYAARERDGVVYLWPDARRKQGREPLVLRLITLTDGRNRRIHLLTDVLGERRLGGAAAGELYRLRWGVELLYRALKQTMRRRKLLSGSPRHAEVELDWSVVGLWVLALMNALAAGGAAPGPATSHAAALRAVRGAMYGRGPAPGDALPRAVLDTYRRTGSRKARHWPHKKRERPPGPPVARKATREEVKLATELKRARRAA